MFSLCMLYVIKMSLSENSVSQLCCCLFRYSRPCANALTTISTSDHMLLWALSVRAASVKEVFTAANGGGVRG